MGVVGEDGESWLPGETHEASHHFARHLIHGGKAVAVDEIAPPPRLTTQMFQTQEPAVQQRDPVRRKK